MPDRPRPLEVLEEGADDVLETFERDEPAQIKNRVVHVRVDVEMWRSVRAAALRVDRKPCEWVRRAIKAALREDDKRRKRKKRGAP
jgi:hypothetical protein